MNQILISENKNKQNKRKNTDLIDMRKIIIIFSVLIIVFALIIVGAKAYGMIRENDEKKLAPLNKPVIDIKKVEQKCRILVEYKDVGLDKVIYSWNDGEEFVRNLNNSKTPYDRLIEIPEGTENKIYVKAIGADGSESELTKTFKRDEEIVNPDGPIIEWEQLNGTNTMIIKVSSEKGIDNFTYQWEGDEVVTVNGNGDNEAEITIDIKRGTNEITLTATDNEGNVQTKQKLINGVKLPEIFVEIRDGNVLYMTVKHDMGIEKAIFRVNGEELTYDDRFPGYDAEKEEFSISKTLQPGETIVEITVYSLEGENSVATYKGKADI